MKAAGMYLVFWKYFSHLLLIIHQGKNICVRKNMHERFYNFLCTSKFNKHFMKNSNFHIFVLCSKNNIFLPYIKFLLLFWHIIFVRLYEKNSTSLCCSPVFFRNFLKCASRRWYYKWQFYHRSERFYSWRNSISWWRCWDSEYGEQCPWNGSWKTHCYILSFSCFYDDDRGWVYDYLSRSGWISLQMKSYIYVWYYFPRYSTFCWYYCATVYLYSLLILWFDYWVLYLFWFLEVSLLLQQTHQ